MGKREKSFGVTGVGGARLVGGPVDTEKFEACLANFGELTAAASNVECRGDF